MSNTRSPILAHRRLVSATAGGASIQHILVIACVALAGMTGMTRFGAATSHAIGGDAQSGAPSAAMVTSQQAGSLEAVAHIAEELHGMGTPIRELWMSVGAPFVEADTFAKLGVKPAKAVLLHGPPGTGKTTLARLTAEQAGVAFIPTTGSALLGQYIGQGAVLVKDLFKEARKAKGGKAIIFIDEIDGLGSRSQSGNMGQFSASAINELLANLDGISADENIVVVAATNNPDALDEALVRAGRFDRKIYIGPPDESVLGEILERAANKLPLGRNVDLQAIAQRLRGYGPADIKAVVETAGRRALERVLLDDARAGDVVAETVTTRRLAAPPAKLMEYLKDNFVMTEADETRFRLSDDGSTLKEPWWITDALEAMTKRAETLSAKERKALFNPKDALVDEESGRLAWAWDENDSARAKFLWESLSDEQAGKLAKHFEEAATEEVRTKPLPTWTGSVRVSKADFEHALSVVRPSAIPEGMAGFEKVDWADIGGYDAVKHALQEAIARPMNNPEAYTKLGLDPTPQNVVLYGPPGTGKTQLVKALATDLGANVFVLKPSEIRTGMVGEGAKKLASIFDRAERTKPAIILIDEMDALAPVRGAASSEDDAIVNELLTQMQGMQGKSGVVVVGTTNRIDQIDPGLLRPGRFGQKVEVGLPDVDARRAILDVHVRSKKIAKNVDLDALAKRTDNMTGAELENLVNEAGRWTIVNAPARRSIPAEAFEHALAEIKKGQGGSPKRSIGFRSAHDPL